MPAPTPKESGISAFITREAGAIPRDVIAVDSPIDVVSSSVADPTVITTKKTHGYRPGQVIKITGHSGSDNDASVNDDDGHEIIVLSDTTFSIPVDLTGGGGTGGTAAPGVSTGIMVVVFAAEDFLPLDSAAVPGPSVTNTERVIRTRGDEDVTLSLPPDTGFDAAGLLQPGDTFPRKREINRITNRLQELLGNRFQRIEVRFIGNPES